MVAPNEILAQFDRVFNHFDSNFRTALALLAVFHLNYSQTYAILNKIWFNKFHQRAEGVVRQLLDLQKKGAGANGYIC